MSDARLTDAELAGHSPEVSGSHQEWSAVCSCGWGQRAAYYTEESALKAAEAHAATAQARAEQPPAGDAAREEPEAGADLSALLEAYELADDNQFIGGPLYRLLVGLVREVTALRNTGVARDERRRG
jgi:hypothetical protein